MNGNILVIGGTGTTGRTLVEILHNADVDFKVMVRSQEKADELNKKGVNPILGELGDWPSVKKALKNVDSVFLLSSPSFTKVAEQNGLIDLAKEEGVRKIVKLSAVIADSGSKIHLADWHGLIEDHLKSSGLDYINLRAHSFMQNMLMLHSITIKNDNRIYESMGDTKIPMIDTRDVAQASYECLTRDDLNNETYTITGPNPISYGDVAESLSKATNRKIEYVRISPEDHNKGLKNAGVPGWLADDLTIMSREWAISPKHEPTSDFNRISSKKQFDINDFAKDYANYFN
ncbi:MAG: NmrA family NAD(P)-binding protein [Bacteroidia bacterium]|nr:NmrA family NAD(P)-binding protein [Bacteroidia bacterium]NND11463.1 NmrA family NAD(P)-binding protein [Flavobacteriaceae bacterium]NNE16544.1 NmrA family NAD(P)-binding protein [Saprospiraceae bacterium]NNK26662.1 NmrA family NAD(P)-binding protein [Flavobacteriaceae bacterium]